MKNHGPWYARDSRQILVASVFFIAVLRRPREELIALSWESGSSTASLSPVPASRLSLLGFAPVFLSASMLRHSGMRQLPAHLPLGHRAFTALDEFDGKAGRWSPI